jgi:hypothetical protein
VLASAQTTAWSASPRLPLPDGAEPTRRQDGQHEASEARCFAVGKSRQCTATDVISNRLREQTGHNTEPRLGHSDPEVREDIWRGTTQLPWHRPQRADPRAGSAPEPRSQQRVSRGGWTIRQRLQPLAMPPSITASRGWTPTRIIRPPSTRLIASARSRWVCHPPALEIADLCRPLVRSTGSAACSRPTCASPCIRVTPMSRRNTSPASGTMILFPGSRRRIKCERSCVLTRSQMFRSAILSVG